MSIAPTVRSTAEQRARLIWIGGAAVAVLAVAYVAVKSRVAPSARAPAPAATVAAAVPSATSSAAVPTLAASAAPSATALSSAEVAGAVDACMVSLLPRGNHVDRPPELARVCTLADPAEAARTIRSEVVLSGRGREVSDAMVEWSQLVWYDIAALVVMRARCCPGPVPLEKGGVYALCDMHATLLDLEGAAKRRDRDALANATDAYQRAIRCLWKGDHGDAVGHGKKPHVFERTVFEQLLARIE